MNLAGSLKQQAALTFSKADALLIAIVDRVEHDGLGPESLERLRLWFRKEAEHSSQFLGFYIVDSSGSMIVTSVGQNARMLLSGREYFMFHRANVDSAVHIGHPVLGSASGEWLIPVSRRLNRPDGTFGGVAVAAINPKYFQNFYNTLDIGKNGAVLLASLDGTLLVRRPYLESNIGRDLTGRGIFKQLKTSPSGTIEITSSTDGIMRLNSYEQDETYPIVLAVAKSVDEMLAPWRTYAIRRSLEAVTVAALMCLLGVAVWRSTRTLSRNSDELTKLNAELSENKDLFSSTLAALPDGLVVYDSNDRLVAHNDAYKEIYSETAPAIKIGVTFSDLLQYGIDRGQYPEAGRTTQQQSEWLKERLKRHLASNSDIVQQLPNGRWLQIRERRTANGYIVGFRTDVTTLKHETAKLQAVIDNFPGGICFLDAECKITAWNSTFLRLFNLSTDIFNGGQAELETVFGVKAERGEYGLGDAIEQARLRVEAGQNAEDQSFELTRPDGTVLEVRGRAIKGGGYIATYTDITARHAAAQRLAESERLAKENSSTLELTLTHMSQGLSMFDASGHLMVWNRRYAEIYRCPAGFLKRGLNVSDIAAHLSQVGYLGTNEPDWRQKIAEGDYFASTLQFEDGRVIRLVRRPIEGSGWVATHEDITEQVRAEAELFQQSADLARINLRFDAALTNMTQGLCLFDADHRLVIANARFREIYNLPPEMVASGISLNELLEYQYRNGIKDERSIEDNVREIPALAQQSVTTSDGRVISIRRAPVEGGGWVATHDDVTEQIRAQIEINRLARHDVLTGLANRAEFNARLENTSKRHSRHGGGFTVMMLDLDKFKAVNDTLGHPAGDQLLTQVAQRLKATLRETDMLARLGGDEFAIISEGGADQREGAIVLALRIIGTISEPFDLDGHEAKIGTSIGIALAPEHGADPEDMIKKADLALYEAKTGGRNDYQLFSESMRDAAEIQQTAESELRTAIERKEFELHYQPVSDAKTRRVCGAEALVRWRHPSKGLLGPDQFIPLAEKTGLIEALGAWILNTACSDANTWPEHIKLAINISAIQFRRGNLFDVILYTLVETGLSPERLELEITETSLLDNQAAHLATIRQLKNLGVSFALDDFGTGYSSINYLTNFPFDKIKIDKSFVLGCVDRIDCKAVVSAVLTLAKGLGKITTAEGVETTEQFEFLRASGVDLVQGYLFGRPMPVARFNQELHTVGDVMVA